MELINKLIAESGFQDKIIVGNAQDKLSLVVSDFFERLNHTKSGEEVNVDTTSGVVGKPEKKTAIVAKEKDYLLLGKTLRDCLNEKGAFSEAFVCDDEATALSQVFSDYKIIVCVGETDFLKTICKLICGFDCKVIYVPTSLVFADVFLAGCDRFFNPDEKVCKCIIDIDLFKKCKRKDLADGYAFCASAVLAFLEYKLSAKIDGVEFDFENASGAVASAYRTLSYITDNNAVAVITVAELYLLKAFRLCRNYSDLAAFSCGNVLAKMTNSPLYECVFGLIGGLLVAIKTYAAFSEKTLFSFSDVNKDIERLSDILKIPQTDVYGVLKLYAEKEIESKKVSLSLIGDVDEEVSKYLSLYKKLLKGYEAVYRGRHKRKNFSLDEERLALKLGSITSFGIMKLCYDDGFLTLICDL